MLLRGQEELSQVMVTLKGQGRETQVRVCLLKVRGLLGGSLRASTREAHLHLYLEAVVFFLHRNR